MAFETTWQEVLDGIDLSGQTVVVTGGTTGLGRETATALAQAGAHVVITARTREKAEQAGPWDHVLLDLTDLDSVRAAAADLPDRVDVLVNNAGVMYTPFERTKQGFELQLGTNHIGHFVLTNAVEPSRVVNLSSGGHRASDIIWDDPNYERRPYDKFEAYGQSKTANILFTRELAHRGTHALAVHPGMIVTDLGRYMTKDDLEELTAKVKAAPGGGPRYKSVEQGAATTVYAVAHPELPAGSYLEDCGVSDEDAPWTRDESSWRRLWELTEELVGG